MESKEIMKIPLLLSDKMSIREEDFYSVSVNQGSLTTPVAENFRRRLPKLLTAVSE